MTWIQTFSGVKFDLARPRPDMVNIQDIAHSLANMCRWAGHTSFFYSVAQHSIIVSDLLPDEDKLWGLLHDAPEAYMGDWASPLKRLIPELYSLEQKLENAIWIALRLQTPKPRSVKAMDLMVLVTEADQLLGPPPEPWFPPNVNPLSIKIEPWAPHVAEREFLSRYTRLEAARK